MISLPSVLLPSLPRFVRGRGVWSGRACWRGHCGSGAGSPSEPVRSPVQSLRDSREKGGSSNHDNCRDEYPEKSPETANSTTAPVIALSSSASPVRVSTQGKPETSASPAVRLEPSSMEGSTNRSKQNTVRRDWWSGDTVNPVLQRLHIDQVIDFLLIGGLHCQSIQPDFVMPTLQQIICLHQFQNTLFGIIRPA